MYCLRCRVLLLAHSVVSGRRRGLRFATLAYTTTTSGALQPAAAEKMSGRLPQLSSQSLHRAALLARLSGLCYYPADQLADRLSAEGMKLVVSGGTHFTSWYVADGRLDRPQLLSLGGPSAAAEQQPESGIGGESGGGEVERVLLLRGVVWRGQDVDALRLWQDLMRFWPSAFAKEHTQPQGILLAHSGVAEMAGSLYEALRMPVMEASALGRPITFGGHSLGGSLALLLAVLFRLQQGLPPELVRSCSFGSPPVLSHGGGGGGDAILKVLGLPKGAVQSFVLENDPIPRALLSVDPTFTALKRSRPGAAFLQLRHWLLGPGVPLTPERFLADNVGDVHLIRWTSDAGYTVQALAPEEMEEQFRIASDQNSASTLQGVLDHAHGSYSLDLDSAAQQLEKRGL